MDAPILVMHPVTSWRVRSIDAQMSRIGRERGTGVLTMSERGVRVTLLA